MDELNKIGLQEFIEKAFIQETDKLIKSGINQSAFLIIALGIETLGSFLDTKPMKAVNQSKVRFSHAINRLMPVSYRALNNNHWFYDKLRTSLTHTFTPSTFLILTDKNDKKFGDKHLHKIGNQVVLVAEDFQSDFKKACLRLIDGMNKGFIPQKKLNTKYYYTF